MEVHNNLTLKNEPLSLTSLSIFSIFNIFLLFFSRSGSFDLSFFAVFSFLVLIYEVNKGNNFLKIGKWEFYFDSKKRNIIFFILSVILLVLILLKWVGLESPLASSMLESLIGLERIFHLLFSLTFMFILYKTVYIDLGILITIFLLGNLVYLLITKNILEVVFHIDYIKFLFQEQDIKKEVQSLLDSYGQGSQVWENSVLNQRILDRMLGFTGVINNIFNTLYFILLIKVFGKRILKLNIRLSLIYFPQIWAWVFLLNCSLLWLFLSITNYSILAGNSSFLLGFLSELMVAGIITFFFMYLLQGFSILLAYIKEQKFWGRPLLSIPFLVFLTVGLITSTVMGLGFLFFINLIIITLSLVGYTDSWVDYRKNYRYKFYSTTN